MTLNIPFCTLPQIENVTSDSEFQSVLMEDDVLIVLGSIGYRGIPSRDTLSSKDKLIRYGFLVIHSTVVNQ